MLNTRLVDFRKKSVIQPNSLRSTERISLAIALQMSVRVMIVSFTYQTYFLSGYRMAFS
jgi:hypothetical protein